MVYIFIVFIIYVVIMKLGMFSFCKVYILFYFCFVDVYIIKVNFKRFYYDWLVCLRVFKSVMGLLCIF